MNRLGVTALAVFAALTMGVPPAQAFTTAAEDPPAQPTGKIKVYPVRSGTYTVTGPHKFKQTASVKKTFQVVPGTYRVTAPNAVITSAKLRVGAGQKRATTVTFGRELRARAVSSDCAVLGDGRVVCWKPGKHPTPRVVPGIDQATSVTTGADHNCALRSDGSVWCWGENTQGQLGDGSTTASQTPVRALGIASATQISAGDFTTCARTADGSVWCWGGNFSGQVGNGSVPETNVGVSTPTLVAGIETAVSVATSGTHSCAVLTDGSVRCWGANSDGQLGNGTRTQYPVRGIPTPVAVQGVSSATSVATGGSFTCALLSSGSVQCWGYGGTGELGNGRFRNSTSPVDVVGIRNAADISAGCAVTSTRKAMCWGSNNLGGLGFGWPPDSVATPIEIPWLAGVREIDGRCLLGRAGTVSCWGGWEYSHHWSTGLVEARQPLRVADTVPTRSVDVGYGFSCAVSRSEHVVCWGANGYGSIGTAFDQVRTTPFRVPGLDKVSSLATGEASACAVLPDGTVKCWGCLKADVYFGCENPRREKPVVIEGITNAKQVVSGNSHRCVLLRSGQVSCWGSGDLGQLGNGHFHASKLPIRVPGLRNVKSLSADHEHTCALLADGTVSCWGCIGPGCPAGDPDYSGEIRPRPKQVLGLRDVKQIATAINESCARTTSGRVQCWGFPADDEYGEYTKRWKPITIEGLRDVRKLFAGSSYNYAVQADGRVKRWEGNGVGKGTDLTTMPALAGATFIAAGSDHSCLTGRDQQLRCWGSNTTWQLGRRNSADRFSPVLITWPNG